MQGRCAVPALAVGLSAAAGQDDGVVADLALLLATPLLGSATGEP